MPLIMRVSSVDDLLYKIPLILYNYYHGQLYCHHIIELGNEIEESLYYHETGNTCNIVDE